MRGDLFLVEEHDKELNRVVRITSIKDVASQIVLEPLLDAVATRADGWRWRAVSFASLGTPAAIGVASPVATGAGQLVAQKQAAPPRHSAAPGSLG